MRYFRRLGLVFCAVAAGCQATRGANIIVLDGDRAPGVADASGAVKSALEQTGVSLAPADRVFVNGRLGSVSAPLGPSGAQVVQVRPSVQVTINGQSVETSAMTVGEAVAEVGHELFAMDSFDPPAGAPIQAGMAIDFRPSTRFTVTADQAEIPVRSAAPSLGEALAGAGMPLIGLDVSEPGSDGPVPGVGNIRIKRVAEALVLAEESTPFDSTYQDSAQLGLGQEQIAQPGVKGLKVTRTRVRYEDGNEVSRQAEGETVVRPAQERVVVRGTKIVENTKTVNGVTIEYWREMQMYATVYSPCESATGSAGECSYGTASGLRAGKGVVAVDPSLYAYLNGQRLYIPGYGFAVIGDLGGGYLLEPAISRYKWIDLGFDDNNMPDMTGWITVYFLAPAPASIPDALK
jgi:uncharacterized protein YabE (DUF348 family)